MKSKGMIIAILILLILTPVIFAEDTVTTTTPDDSGKTIQDFGSELRDGTKDANLWNETISISPVWQEIVGTFFGLNLHNESTEISVREAIIYFMIFVMFLVIILDVLNLLKLFNLKPIWNFFISLAITTLASITGAFINLKNLFMTGVSYTVESLDWGWLNFMIQNKFWGIILTMFVVIPIILIIHELLSWIEPLIKKYSQISRAEAKGRKINEVVSSKE